MLQDTNKRLQEYNTSLQQYNCNLQADATKNAETIDKLQKEKNTMVETMNGLKDHSNSVKLQLDMAKVIFQFSSFNCILYALNFLITFISYILIAKPFTLQSSQSEALKQKNNLLSEVEALRGE